MVNATQISDTIVISDTTVAERVSLVDQSVIVEQRDSLDKDADEDGFGTRNLLAKRSRMETVDRMLF